MRCHAGMCNAQEPGSDSGVEGVIVADRLYSVRELQVVLQCSERQVYQHMSEGLQYAHVGSGRRVLGSDLLEFVRARRVRR